jgi:2-deoxy-D-gluconate 3-dehydrogenase
MAGLLDLDGLGAFVTGASRGIGRAIAIAMAEAGADVAVAARDVAALDGAAAEVASLGRRVVVAPCDVVDRDAVDAAIAGAVGDLGRLDVVVNAAGVASGAKAEELDRDTWDEVLDVNLRASFDVAQAAYPYLSEGPGGSIINIGSAYSIFGSPYSAAYAASKGGVIQLTKSLAVSWARRGIRVNAIVPGWIVTDMTEPALTIPEIRASIEDRTPMGRFGYPEEVAGVAVFLASPAARFITGHALVVDGGYTIA